MKAYHTVIIFLLLSFLDLKAQDINRDALQHFPGFVDFFWDEDKGKVYFDIHQPGDEFLYTTGLSAGVGSNDIGLDRGQLGGEHVVYFDKRGERILLIEKNLGYRADSENPAEQQSVEGTLETITRNQIR